MGKVVYLVVILEVILQWNVINGKSLRKLDTRALRLTSTHTNECGELQYWRHRSKKWCWKTGSTSTSTKMHAMEEMANWTGNHIDKKDNENNEQSVQ